MENQVQELRDRNLPAALLHSECQLTSGGDSTDAGATTAEIAIPVARNAAECVGMGTVVSAQLKINGF